MVEQRTALANQLRAFLAEQGVIIPVGIQSLQHHLPDVLEDENNVLSSVLRRLLYTSWEDLRALNLRIHDMDKAMAALSRQQPGYDICSLFPVSVPLLRLLS
ncbi:hypothetical protein Ppb6_03599 [Photorhabdus australis subsp. thailandensis]|uniref:Uncharacterized protein n=1 Tax=Photorhabdus australis subsp. thailandensis TaxID=2805096 RepID=A0A1C0U049_9GAMM|nr:hypothetical protein Ppb6_03599 [Photorhabdus australis subsp. thailandensis]